MPSIFSKAKSNRSHQSVDNSSGQSSPNPSALAVNNDASPQRFTPDQQQQQQQAQVQAQQLAQGQYRQQHPQRAQSTHRLSAHLDQIPQGYQPQQQQQQQQQQPGPPQPSPGLDQSHRVSYQPQSPPPYVPEPKKQSLGSRLAGRLTGSHKDSDSKDASKNGIDRRKSVRKSDPKLVEQQQQQQLHDANRLQAQQWQQRQGSSPHLPPSNERDEDNLDPFLQQDTPQVPPKDIQYQQHPPQQQQQQQQQFVPHQQQYNRPPLDRVSTEGSGSYSGGVSQYSPDQHQQPNQQQQYHSYQPPPQHPQNSTEYQAFNPQTAPSPLLGNAQLHAQGQDTSPQSYYAYQHQNPQVQTNSPQDNSPQSIQYQQQKHFAPPSQSQPQPQPQPHQGQSYPQPVPSQRPASQQPPELQHPQANRNPPQIVQQAQPIDPQQLQQLRPPSSQQQLAPPSPLQPQPQQTYDPQQGKPPPATDTPSASSTPPQQGQDSMAPSGPNSGRNTLRKVNDAGQQQPGAPSREASLLQQPPAQASQGQPYRGDKGQQGQGEMGRATPPPRPTAAEMSDEEVEKLMKEHEVLREKYQKVKRYFFEQQTQVHQLQNTLANQRLSLSRTSWDDSEYSTRFTRLDGLIAQLSFSIRKDWKAIPHFLHPVVNKTAVETGKQEMTAVGRAFISHWLVENIFEKYFHPDLEPGFSTQLQTIVSNIRKFSPACHSPEDEDSLAAKIINWRLATLEGLADVLRSPQAATHRQNLLETLNESLIASLQMHMNDPAPPDLNGGVPMIIELAISIAQHLPLESREVHIEYFPPGHGIVAEFMKMETGIPALTAPIAEPLDEHEDRASLRSVASKVEDNASITGEEIAKADGGKDDKKRSMFGFGGGSKKPNTIPAGLTKRESTLGAGGSQQSLSQPPPGSSSGPKDEQMAPRVRMAVGVAVQIRGKSILIKAPVYST